MAVSNGKILANRDKVQFEADRDQVTTDLNVDDKKREHLNCVTLYLHVHQSSREIVNGYSVCGTDSVRAMSYCVKSKMNVSHAHRLAITVGYKSENVA